MPSPTWTKKDYEFFAQVLNNTPMSDVERDWFAQRFAEAFRADNANFDSTRFDAAVFRGELTHRGGTAAPGKWTRKTYVMTAGILADAADLPEYGPAISPDTRVALISAFGAAFERDNPAFDWDRFRRAAGSPYAPSTDPVAEQIRRVHGDEAAQRYLDDLERGREPMSDDEFERMASTPDRWGSRRVRVRPHSRRVYEPSGDEYATTMGREDVYRRPPEVRVRRHPLCPCPPSRSEGEVMFSNRVIGGMLLLAGAFMLAVAWGTTLLDGYLANPTNEVTYFLVSGMLLGLGFTVLWFWRFLLCRTSTWKNSATTTRPSWSARSARKSR